MLLIFKKKFSILRDEGRLLHEGDMVRLIFSCAFIHKLTVYKGYIVEDLEFEENIDQEVKEK